MVKELRPITFVRDLRNEFNKRFDVEPTSVEQSKRLHPATYHSPDDEGEALDPAVAVEAPSDDDATADDAKTARRKRTARD